MQFFFSNEHKEGEEMDNDRLSVEAETILKGILSKITFTKNTCKFRSSSHQVLLQKDIEMKYQREAEDAQRIFDQSLKRSYKETKKKLFTYGRSLNFKMKNVFEKESNLHTLEESVKEIKKNRIESVIPERTVFLDRKYHKEIANKTSMLFQVEAVEKMKQLKRKVRSEHNSPLGTPLAYKMEECNSRKTIKPNSNPLLLKRKANNLRKRKWQKREFLMR